MSGFAAVTSLEVGGLVAEFAAAPAGILPPGALAGFVAPAVAIGGFDGGFAPAAGFGDELFGLAVAFALAAFAVAGFAAAGFPLDVADGELAADDELAVGVDVGFDAGDAALPAADVGAAVTGVCDLGTAVPEEAGAFAGDEFGALAFAGAASFEL
jgi:hypothetical protein